MLKKVLTWGGISFLVFFVAFRPSAATSVVRGIGQTLIDVGNGISAFFSGVVGVLL